MNREALEAAREALWVRRRKRFKQLIDFKWLEPPTNDAMLGDARAAIEAYLNSLAKAGLGIMPREATEEMLCHTGAPILLSEAILKAMWDKYLDKKPAVRIAKPPLRQRQSLR